MLNLAGCSHFARHYSGNLGWFLFLQLLRCFSSPRSPCIPMYSVCNTPKGGFPHSEICGSMCVCSLPAAYRKLQRPSSPDIAKASTMCTYSLVSITLASVFQQNPVSIIDSLLHLLHILSTRLPYSNALLELKKQFFKTPSILDNTIITPSHRISQYDMIS